MSENKAEVFLQKEILREGGLSIGSFMSHALCHPDFGYYQVNDPFGVSGDFITAPEVSQMFGEVIGAWIADLWIQMGQPQAFNLIECGPGRGTLMADILRAVKGVDGFHDAARLYLLENSPGLRQKQCESLSDYDPKWCQSVKEVEANAPSIIIGNEFLDALPIEQLIRIEKGWQQRIVHHDPENGFVFGLREAPKDLLSFLPSKTISDQYYEVSPQRRSFMNECADHIKAHKGALLFLDYGHASRHYGDTLQAIKEHDYASPLKDIGSCDITAHVDFEAIFDALTEKGMHVLPVVTQRHFLCSLGIEHRAKALYSYALKTGSAVTVDADLKRLIGQDQMGCLFKVLGAFYGFNYQAVGF